VRPLADAQREVLAAMAPLPETVVALGSAMGLALARPVRAGHPIPPFDNSAVDGFAVISADVAEVPATLEIIDDVPAGTVSSATVTAGTAIRIMTGAPMPAGADAVVMVEDTEVADGRVIVGVPVSAGGHVRPAGGDVQAGSVVFEAGDRITAAHVGVLASIGVAEPRVHRRPRVAVISTGDELAPASVPHLEPGGIRDSNGPMLAALLTELGVEVVDMGIVPDDEGRLRSAFGAAAGSCDAVVTSGGVSMGEHDYVKAVLRQLGGIEFWQVAMQPAKPFAFGLIDGTPLFGLPGNPVSAFVGYEQLVRPALLARMGARRLFRPRGRARLVEAVSTSPEKTVFMRMTVVDGPGGPQARPSGGQGSNVLSAMAAADALGVVPVGVGDMDAGDEIVVEWFGARETRTAEEALA
jgi:molybdopterin molybdotransferase